MKTCSKCNLAKPLDRYSFRNKRTGVRRRECKDCLNKLRTLQPSFGKWHKENKERLREYNKAFSLKRHYGMSMVEYNKLIDIQKNACAICKRNDRPLFVDHCHKRGDVRGILCQLCNMGLGAFSDNPKLFFEAVKYLEERK